MSITLSCLSYKVDFTLKMNIFEEIILTSSCRVSVRTCVSMRLRNEYKVFDALLSSYSLAEAMAEGDTKVQHL